MSIEFPSDHFSGGSNTLILCFVHDHLKEVLRIQSRVIEAALLHDDFASHDTVENLRRAAAVYLRYADQIEDLIGKKPSAEGDDPSVIVEQKPE